MGKKNRKRGVCDNAPESCFNCPFTDCIKNGKSTRKETQFMADAIGDKYHRGDSLKGRTKGDKQKNQGQQGAG